MRRIIWRRQQGFSLVELIISVGLGAALLLGVLQIFDANNQSARVQQALSEVQENGRIASELLARDIRMADYWGCAPNSGVITDHLNRNSPNYSSYDDITGAPGIEAKRAVAGETAIGGLVPRENTDVLILRGARGAGDLKVKDPVMTPNTSAIHIEPTVYTNINLGDVVLITDCTGGNRFSNSNDLSSATSSNANTLFLGFASSSQSGGSGIDNATEITNRQYDQSAQILFPFSRAYFIAENDVGSHSLFRAEGGGNGEVNELVRHIDSVTYLFGEDTTDTGSVDRFVEISGVSNWDKVLSVRPTFTLLSSLNVVDGGPLTREYSFTANIRNRTLK